MNALTFAAAQLMRLLPRAALGRAAGHIADLAWPAPLGRAIVRLYSHAYGVALDECPEAVWPSFDAFFTRGLREGCRPVDTDPHTIVSPADGRIDSLARVSQGSTFRVKGSLYSVAELVGDAGDGRRYDGGAALVVYLSPRDYHRVHSPVAGVVAHVRSMPGDYYPVNAIGLRHVPDLLARNRRVAVAIDTPAESGLGRVTVVMVSAMIVGSITVAGIDARDVPLGHHTLAPPLRVERGTEIGRFRLGSTAVVFLEPRAAGAWLVAEGPIRYGQALCRAVRGGRDPKPNGVFRQGEANE